MRKQKGLEIIDTKFGTYITEIEHNGKNVSLYADGNFYVLVSDAGHVIEKQYMPDAEGAFKDYAQVL